MAPQEDPQKEEEAHHMDSPEDHPEDHPEEDHQEEVEDYQEGAEDHLVIGEQWMLIGMIVRVGWQYGDLIEKEDQMNKEAKIDIKKLDPFTGLNKMKWEPFILQLYRIIEAKCTICKDDQDKITFAVTYLTDAAAAHYDNLLRQQDMGDNVIALYNWPAFVAEWEEYFGIFNTQ
ncbi:hypothetical protein GYMLUDRAFT_239108 [Collybiopsis luxurians FD-317 M1]|nr:hypothetical protein GYMLUDRAFT_239108 [Collybiopsis luxurians FD-317 M1]